jgi:hypothetical protein
MDDGSQMNLVRGIHFATQSFTEKEVRLLAEVLNSKFKLEAVVHRHSVNGRIKHRIYIPKQKCHDLLNLILPYLHSSLMYKVEKIMK